MVAIMRSKVRQDGGLTRITTHVCNRIFYLL